MEEKKTEPPENRGKASQTLKKKNATFWSSSNYKYTPVNKQQKTNRGSLSISQTGLSLRERKTEEGLCLRKQRNFKIQGRAESVERTFCYACTLSSASSSFVHQSDSFGKFTSQMLSILSVSKPPAASFLMKTEGIIPY
jgi:hypothetical protein